MWWRSLPWTTGCGQGPYLFPGTYSVAAGMSCAGTLIPLVPGQLCPGFGGQGQDEGTNVFGEIAKLADGIPAGSDGLTILPYFSGERTPINNPMPRV